MGVIEIIEADLDRPDHQRSTVEMINAYSMDIQANGRPLPDEVCQALVPGLRNHPTTLIFLAFDGERPVGIATCFLGFSTFAARQLINVHDLGVVPEYRGQGVGRRLLEEVARKGRELGCCKVTLEVFESNPARRMYEAAGFVAPDYQTSAGGMLFLVKSLSG